MRVLCALLVVVACTGCATYDDRVVTDRYGDKWERCSVKGGRPAWCRLDWSVENGEKGPAVPLDV